MALALFAALVLAASPLKSAAFDEQYHLTAGYSYLRTGDVRLATTHPPLMGLLAGLALLRFDDVTLPLDHPSWAAGDRFLFSDIFLWESNPDPHRLLVAARQPITMVGLILLAALFWWMWRLLGPQAAWLALGLAVFDPNLLANARVITTDLGLSCFLLLAIWRLWCWLERRTLINLLLAGVCAGLAMGAKYTGLLVWPSALLILALYPAVEPDRAGGDRWTRRLWIQRLAALGGMGLIAYAVIWALYRFEIGPLPEELGGLSVPASFYWTQLWRTLTRIVNLREARLDFLLGQASSGQWWYYFPVAMAYKMPLALCIMSLTGLVLMIRRRAWRRWSVLWAVPAVFITLGLNGILTIGFRHILPVVPFLIALASSNVLWADGLSRSRARLVSAACALLALWPAIAVVRLFPHYDSYFNELAGPWTNWSNILVDSNLDWGQDLPALRQVMAEMGIERVNLAYFGKAVPEVYGVRYQPLPSYLRFVEGVELNAYNPYTPEPGWYAISASSLRLGLFQAENVDLYAYFRDKQPAGRAGYSIYVYKVDYPPEMPVDRVVVVGDPAAAKSAETLGVKPGRRVQVKWARSPETVIFSRGEGFAEPDDAKYHPVGAEFAGALTLVGYLQEPDSPKPGETVRFVLFWRVGSQPVEMPAPTRGSPLSAFLHMTEAEPWQIVAQYDGWPVALRGLEEGDVIIHHAEMEVSDQVKPGEYHLLAGLYSPQNGVRLPVRSPAGETDHVALGVLEVED
jgi:hypothetical protein